MAVRNKKQGRRATTSLQAISILHKHAPGDITVLTALIRDLKLTYGKDIRIGIHPETNCKDLLLNNPYTVPYTQLGKHRTVNCQYGVGIKLQRNEPVHFLPFFHRDFTKQTGLPVEVKYPWPDLHLSQLEQKPLPGLPPRYWVVMPGGKNDITIKIWASAYFQEVINTLQQAFGIQCVLLGSYSQGYQPPLQNACDWRGRTNLRQMLQVIAHADGVICGVTAAMHMAAALHRPCVVIAGSREAWWWEAYAHENPGLPKAELLPAPHRFLHTHSLIDCRDYFGCWRNKVRPLHDPKLSAKIRGDKSLCMCPVQVAGQDQAECMARIKPTHVVQAVMSYYKDLTLPPIQELPDMPKLVQDILEQLPAAAEPASAITRNSAPTIILPESRPEPAPLILPETGYDPDYDDPVIGGRVTAHVLLYGNFPEMHRTCLESLCHTLPKDRFELRVASAALCNQTLDYVQELEATGVVSWHYRRTDNPGKYRIMRQLFRDPEHPITTKWLLWFDDDTVCNKDPIWFRQLCGRIIKNYDKQVRLVGPAALMSISPAMAAWIKQAKWYQQRQFRTKQGQEAPNGNWIHFATGSLWAMATEMIELADIPDARLEHNGGDFTIGEQIWQAGYTSTGFSNQKQSVNWSSVKRRGRSDTFPWLRRAG